MKTSHGDLDKGGYVWWASSPTNIHPKVVCFNYIFHIIKSQLFGVAKTEEKSYNITETEVLIMDFSEICLKRQSCRKYDSEREVEREKLDAVLEAARLSPSACNGQPYHITVCRGDIAKQVAKATMSMGLNGFTDEAPILLVISEEAYVKSAALGSKISGNDYRSMDMGILSAYITAAATEQGLSTCIVGWLNGEKIQKICGINNTVRLVITLGYAHPEDKLRTKKRKSIDELVNEI